MEPNQSYQEPVSPEPQGAPQPVVFPIQETYLTYGLLAVLVLVHLYVMGLSNLDRILFYNDYANVAERVAQGDYYRLFTSMFLHADLTHLLFNCMFIYIFGRDIESLFGSFRFGIIYLLGGLLGSVASFAITRGSSIGASGAAFAIFGAVVAYYYQNRALYGKKITYERLRSLGILALINLGIGLVSNVPGSPVRIDNAAHIGGALGGIMLAWFICPVFEVRVSVSEGRLVPMATDKRHAATWIIAPIGFILLLAMFTLWALSTW